jgi:hypothetical protein
MQSRFQLPDYKSVSGLIDPPDLVSKDRFSWPILWLPSGPTKGLQTIEVLRKDG